MVRCFSLKSIAIKPSIASSSSAPNLHSTNSSTNNNNSNSTHHNHNQNSNFSSGNEENEDKSSPEEDPLSPNLLYSRVVQGDSYTEIRDWLQTHHHHQQVVVSPLLRPNRTAVEESLRRAPETKLTHLLSSYFRHSELTSQFLYSLLCCPLHSVRSLYSPLHEFVNEFNAETLTLSPTQCHHLLHLFHNFLQFPDPFTLPKNPNPTNVATFFDVRSSFSDLKLQHDRRLRRAQSLTSFPGSAIRGSALCIWSAFKGPAHLKLPGKFVKRQLEHIAQLDAAAIGAYVVNNELETINCLVKRLQDVVESDRGLVKFGWERGRDDDNGNCNRYPIQEVVKQLKSNKDKLLKQMEDLEEHVYICLTRVNQARSRLFHEIHQQQQL